MSRTDNTAAAALAEQILRLDNSQIERLALIAQGMATERECHEGKTEADHE